MIKQYIAVKAIIKNGEGRVLLLRQSYESAVDGAGRYHAPGGIVEPGETLLKALKREVFEETKLEIDVIGLLTVEEWQANIRGDNCYFIGIFYECKLVGGALDVTNDETTGFAWIGKNDLVRFDILQPSKKVIESVF